MSARRILLIDDHPHSREIYRVILEQRGFSVVTAADGGEGIRKLGLGPPDVVMLDLFLPGEVQGWDVLRELRGHPSTRDVSLYRGDGGRPGDDSQPGDRAGLHEFSVETTRPLRARVGVEADSGPVDGPGGAGYGSESGQTVGSRFSPCEP